MLEYEDLRDVILVGYSNGGVVATDADRRTDQPLKPLLQPVAVKNPEAAALSRTFVYCTEGMQDIGPLHLPVAQAAEKAKADDRWRYFELNTGHMPMWTPATPRTEPRIWIRPTTAFGESLQIFMGA